MCLKLDLAKAFDNVNRNALLEFMEKQGFDDKWLGWISECINKPSFSIIINGSPHGHFTSSNGIRQGDPLSPLLFCITMEMLSVFFVEAQNQKRTTSPFSRGSTTITHLMFADDLMVFADGNISCASEVLNCLNKFSITTGLEVNKVKSVAFYAGLGVSQKRRISHMLQIKEGKLPISYLGLPLISSRLSANDCTPLISKIRKRMQLWCCKNLAQAGRIELVKSVLSSFHIYWASSFALPKGILKQIEKIFRDFIWGGPDCIKKIHSISWSEMCKPKSEGGAGIRTLEDICRALQVKLLWHLLQKKQSLWTNWIQNKYVKRKNIWTAPMPSKPSWGIRNIFKARELAKPFICYQIGNEEEVDLWDQPWLPAGTLSSLFHRNNSDYSLSFLNLLSDICMDGIWKPQLYIPSLRDEKAVLSQIILSDDECNHPIWKPATDGAYNTKSGWDTLRNKTPKPPWPATIWYQGHIPRFAFTAWKAMHNKMLTKDRIRSYGIMIDPICSLCKSEPEAVDHLFFRCSYSAWIWKNLLGRAGYRRRLRLSLLEEEEWVRLHSKGKGLVATTLKHCFSSLIHHLWTERNQRIFLSSSTHKKYILRSILMETSTKINGMNLYDIPTQKNQKVAMHFNLKLSPKTAEPRICYWIPPNNLEFKLNADALSVAPMGYPLQCSRKMLLSRKSLSSNLMQLLKDWSSPLPWASNHCG
ncbi:uncharacterized protein LOC143875681 [Tasmannia lanceolata]|uniref:uncharacterized protein LOC143875681 n=1 Tax=Tasmannia lanceolata TaxID=3420 RepID=UPI0040636E4C